MCVNIPSNKKVVSWILGRWIIEEEVTGFQHLWWLLSTLWFIWILAWDTIQFVHSMVQLDQEFMFLFFCFFFVMKACLVLVPFNDLSQPYFPGNVGIVLCLVSPTCLVLCPSIIPVCPVFVTFPEPIPLASAPYILQITLFCV